MQGGHVLIACSYFSFTPRVIVEVEYTHEIGTLRSALRVFARVGSGIWLLSRLYGILYWAVLSVTGSGSPHFHSVVLEELMKITRSWVWVPVLSTLLAWLNISL